VARITVQCRDCHTVTRVIVPDAPLVHNGPIYCVYCGSSNTDLTQSHDLDWQEVMSETYGVPWPNLEPIYDAWCQQRSVPKFHDYVMDLIKGVTQ
jgi:hypothetical protein